MFETKKDYNETEMRTLIELLYGSIAIKEQALSSKIFLWDGVLINITIPRPMLLNSSIQLKLQVKIQPQQTVQQTIKSHFFSFFSILESVILF